MTRIASFPGTVLSGSNIRSGVRVMTWKESARMMAWR